MDDDEFKPPSQLAMVPMSMAPNTIKLSDLLDFALQQVFHEITVLSELLPKKLDADRKISLVQFAHNVRMLFVKILGLVKWVKSSKRFEQCTAISYFLEQQSQLLLDSADRLFHIHTELTFARLPKFDIIESIDTLTQGSYTRLPMCIKDSFIKKRKLKPAEQANVLRRLNQIIHYRVARESISMSPRIKEIRIRNGHLTLVVPGEFEVQLTLLSEKTEQPWTLLNIKILVEDYEIGFGSQLVHPLQLNRIHGELQYRMDAWQKENRSSLSHMYKFLHHFAQSLQLDVLWCQATQLGAFGGQYQQKIIIEKYEPKERVLVIGYWLKKVVRAGQSSQFRIVPDYRVTIMGTNEDGPLKVIHSPGYSGLGTIDDRSGRLSIDRLLSETFIVRAKERLLRIKKRIEAAAPKTPIAFLGQAVPYLKIPLLKGSVRNSHECLSISINLYSGKVFCELQALNKDYRDDIIQLENMLYDDFKPLEVLKNQLSKTRILLLKERYKRAVKPLQVRVVQEAQMVPFFKKIRSLSPNRICLQFIKEETYYLIITFDVASCDSIKLGIHLLNVTEDKCQLLELSEVPHVFDTFKRVIPFDTQSYSPEDHSSTTRKKFTTSEKQLIYAIATVDDRLGFMKVKQDLDKRGIHLNSVEEEKDVGSLVLNITDFSQIGEIKSEDFGQHLTRCAIRLDNRQRGAWQLECTMSRPPLYKDMDSAIEPLRCSLFMDLKSSEQGIAPVIIDRLIAYSNIYEIVKKFAKAYEVHYHKHCSVMAFTYHKLVLAYGDNKEMLLFLTFQRQQDSHFKLNFGYTQHPGSIPSQIRWNPHTSMVQEMSRKFNKTNDLIDLVNHLIITADPLFHIQNFLRQRFISVRPYCTAMGTEASFPLLSKGHVTVLNRTTVRLNHGNISLEIAILMEEKVALRDASRGSPKAAGLYEFATWIAEKDDKVEILGDEPEDYSNDQIAYNQNPWSVGNSLQVPHQGGMEGTSPRSRSPMISSFNLRATRRVMIMNNQTLEKLLRWQPKIRSNEAQQKRSGVLHSYLDDYLTRLSFIRRLTNIMDKYNSGQGVEKLMAGLQIQQVYSGVDYVKVQFLSLATGGGYPVLFHLFMCPESFELKVLISYSAQDTPISPRALTDLQNFAQGVVNTRNEIAVISFLMLLRLTVYDGMNLIAPYLRVQRETMKFHIPMVYKVAQQNEKILWKFSPGCLISQEIFNINVKFSGSTKTYRLAYNYEINKLDLRNMQQEDQPLIEKANDEAKNCGECAIAVFIRQNFKTYSSPDLTTSLSAEL